MLTGYLEDRVYRAVFWVACFLTCGSAALCWQNEAKHLTKEKQVNFSKGMFVSFSPFI